MQVKTFYEVAICKRRNDPEQALKDENKLKEARTPRNNSKKAEEDKAYPFMGDQSH